MLEKTRYRWAFENGRKRRISILPDCIGEEYSTKTVYELAKKYGVNATSIQKKLRNLNVQMYHGRIHRYSDEKIVDVSKKVEQILLGSILGDGHLRKDKNMTYPLFDEAHCTQQKDYLLWKKENMSPIPFRIKESCIENQSKRRFPKIRVWTNEQPILEKYFRMSLRERLKNLSFLGLAVWYMDNGTFHKKRKYIRLCTHRFGYSGNEIIKNWFWQKYKIKSAIHNGGRKGEKSFYLYFPTKESAKFLELINPYYHKSLSYKFNIISSKNDN